MTRPRLAALSLVVAGVVVSLGAGAVSGMNTADYQPLPSTAFTPIPYPSVPLSTPDDAIRITPHPSAPASPISSPVRHAEYLSRPSAKPRVLVRRAARRLPIRPKPIVPTVAQARAYARSFLGAAGFGCLDPLWARESGWNPFARNRVSGAYGIPQALPGDKMAAAGSDWRYDPLTQVRWGLGYIRSVYRTACAALAHSNLYGWY